MRRGVRSATGCKECRARHVKCDETKPVCLRCSKRKSTCTYGRQLEWRHSAGSGASVSVEKRKAPRSKQRSDQKPNEAPPVNHENSGVDLEAPGMMGLLDPLTILSELAQWDEQYASMFLTENNTTSTYPAYESLLADSVWLYEGQTPASNMAEASQLVSATRTSFGPSLSSLELDLDRGALLMDFYFMKVAPIFSCYDGGKNPFHHLIARVWRSEQTSTEYRALIGAIQGLAAVFLATHDPSLQAEASRLQRQTEEQLDQVAETRDSKFLFALVLLGISRMYSEDVPSSFKALRRLRDILQLEAMDGKAEASRLHDRELRFFWGLQVHCEVFFACTHSSYSLPAIPMQIRYARDDSRTNIYPHPFTGVASSINTALLEVIQLVKRQRRLAKSHAFASKRYLADMERLMAEAVDLEHRVFSQSVPEPDSIEDPQDPSTPVEHLVKMAQCQRDTSLLQLYRVFPDLLDRRLGLDQDCVFPGDDDVAEKHCLSMALHILDTLSSIPECSGTTPFQTILLLSTSSELRFCPIARRDPGIDLSDTTQPAGLGTTSVTNIRVIEARDFVVTRLSNSQKSIPGGRLPRLLETLQKIWGLLDDEDRDEIVYWFDVVMQ